jgi:hypothetical protein
MDPSSSSKSKTSRKSSPKKPQHQPKKLDTLESVQRFQEFPSLPSAASTRPVITYHKKSLESIFDDEEGGEDRLYQWVIQNKTVTHVYIDKPAKEPQNLLYTKVISVSKKALINMSHLLFFFKRYVIRYLDALFDEGNPIILYIYICSGGERDREGENFIIPKELVLVRNQKESHHRSRRSRGGGRLTLNGSTVLAPKGAEGCRESSNKRGNNQTTANNLISKINAKTSRSGLLVRSVDNHNHIIESLTSESTLQFYEQSLYGQRHQLLNLHNPVQALVRFLRSIYRFFPPYFIRKFFLTSGSILMLNGLRMTNDIDFRITIFNLKDMMNLKEKMEVLIRPMELDFSYVTDEKEYIITDPSKHFFFMGIKCQVVEDVLITHYQHKVRDDRIKSKADVLMASYLLNENVPIYFSKEDIPVSQKKRMIQIFKFYYKITVTIEEIDAMIDQHPRLVRKGNKGDDNSANRKKVEVQRNINAIREKVAAEKKKADDYVQIRIPW